MQTYGPHLFETPDGTQILTPPTSATPEGFTVPPAYRSLPGDVAYGVPIQAPGPDGWMLEQFLNLQTRILNPVQFNERQQRTIRELLARVFPLLDVCASFPLTADDIRLNTWNYHKRDSPHMLYAEFIVGLDEATRRGPALLLHLDAMRSATLRVVDADFHQEHMPHIPVTYRDYQRSCEQATPTREEAELEAQVPLHIIEGSPEWANYLALQDSENTLFQLRRRLAQVVTTNEDHLIPHPIDTCGELKAVCLAYQAAEPGTPIPAPGLG